MSVARDVQATIDAIKASYGSPIQKGVTPDIAKDFNLAQNLVPFNLEAGARLLFPVLSPIRNVMPRKQGKGTSKRFKAVNGINTGSLGIFVAEGVAAGLISQTTSDILFPYVSMGQGSAVTLEAQLQGEGQLDARALAASNLLRSYMIAEEQAILFGQSSGAVSAISSSNGGPNVSIGGLAGTPTAPTVVGSASGGSLAAATYYVTITAVTGQGESLAYATLQSYVAGGSASSITVTPPARPAGQAILYYNIYIGTTNALNGATFQKLTQATNGAAVVITSYTAGTATPPNASSVIPGQNVDNTGSALAFNGIFPQIAASASGAYVSFANAILTLANIDTMLKSMWDNGRADPNQLYVNSTESLKISALTLGVSGSPYFLVVKDHTEATSGYRVSRLINKITGTEVKVDVHPTIPQGNILALSTEMPPWYPGSDIESVWSMDMVMDYTQLDYFPTGPRYPFEIRTIGCMVLYLPAIQGWLGGLVNG